ncbi:macro domain-containing protein [Candidatus Kaiserbacteria bacterium]|nr:macro domain-containing protein [Candidatus Kaiserbacteria bacterium]
MTQVKVASGDIARVQADALITAINSGGAWFGGIDAVINRVAGNLFHDQAGKAMPLKDGQTVVALSNNSAHDGAFKNVVFVVDDLKQSLHQVIYNGLRSASESGFRKVSLPTIRMGFTLGVVEKDIGEAVDEMVRGVRAFLAEHPGTPIEDITFVVYKDLDTLGRLDDAFQAN